MNKSELIKARLSELGISQKKVADLFGVTPQTVSGYVRGETEFGKEMAKKWSDEFGFSVGWLLTGEGSVLKESSQSGSTSVNIGTIQNVGRDQHIRDNSEANELRIEIVKLQSENTHLRQIVAEKEERIKEKERTIGILLRSN